MGVILLRGLNFSIEGLIFSNVGLFNILNFINKIEMNVRKGLAEYPEISQRIPLRQKRKRARPQINLTTSMEDLIY